MRRGERKMENVKMTYGNAYKEFANLRKIEDEKDFDESARYYSEETIKRGNSVYQFTRLYDKDFNFIEDATIAYSNLLKGLTRITDKPEAVAMAAYHLEPLEKGFYEVCRTEYTAQALESMAKTVAKEKGWRV